MKKKKILALTNYKPDKQYSMLKFAEHLLFHCGNSGDIEISEIYPLPVFGKFMKYSYLKKWFSYIDKYMIFPDRLRHNLVTKFQDIDIIHITDHSNSPYFRTIKKLSSAKKLITIHDLIAIRTARGDFTSAPRVSLSGKILQKWIRKSLSCADFFACDSEQTRNDLANFVPRSQIQSKVIHLGTELSKHSDIQNSNIDQFFISNKILINNYILHIGSAAWYKNRKSIITSFAHIKTIDAFRNLQLILVGPKLQDHELNRNTRESLIKYSQDLIVLNNVPDKFLPILYRMAKAFIFPSFIEGFGWPPIEAASLGCPTVTTKCGAIHEILGNNVIYVDPYDQRNIDATIISTLEKGRSIKNIEVPTFSKCINKYAELYEHILNN